MRVKFLRVWSTVVSGTIHKALTAFRRVLIRQYETMTHPVSAEGHESTRVQGRRLSSQGVYGELLILTSTQISRLEDERLLRLSQGIAFTR